MHRIDRVTTGLCLVAKTAFGQQALSETQRALEGARARLGGLEKMPGETLQLEAILLDMIVDRLESQGTIAERGMPHLSMSIPNGAG